MDERELTLVLATKYHLGNACEEETKLNTINEVIKGIDAKIDEEEKIIDCESKRRFSYPTKPSCKNEVKDTIGVLVVTII